MSGAITERIRDYLLRRPASAAQVAESIPDLAEHGGEQRALLLMRLDPHLERAGAAIWVARGSVLTEERRVVHAAEEYFRSLDRPGAPLSSAAAVIAERSHVSPRRVHEILRDHFLIVGSNVFNRPRQGGA
jgi:hypothetical protein